MTDWIPSFLRRRTPWSRRSNANASAFDDQEFVLTRSESNLSQDATSSINELHCDKKSLSGQTLDSEDDTGSHVGTQPCGDYFAPFQYCRPCQIARAAPGYAERVARLMDPLYCAVCKCEHPAILFSLSSRQSLLPSRTCIAHEGYLRICPHLKLSLHNWCNDLYCMTTRELVKYHTIIEYPQGDFCREKLGKTLGYLDKEVKEKIEREASV